MIWSAVQDRPRTSEAELASSLGLSAEAVRHAVQSLIREGRLQRERPDEDANRQRVFFYFGQYIEDRNGGDAAETERAQGGHDVEG